jgi:isoquinoline 1-oxidoreductase beta subunit
VKGVQETVTLDTFKPPHLFQPLGGVAVIANNTWAALQGRRKLKVDWNDGGHGTFESDAFKKQLVQTVSQPAKVVRNLGNVDTEFAKGGKVLEATYYTPLARTVMSLRCWPKARAGTGADTESAGRRMPYAVLGIDKKTSSVTSRCGGGFRSKVKPDYAAEAAVLATRQAQRSCGRRHQVRRYHNDRCRVSKHGRWPRQPTAWLHRSAFPDHRRSHRRSRPLSFELIWDSRIFRSTCRTSAENGPDAHVRIGWFAPSATTPCLRLKPPTDGEGGRVSLSTAHLLGPGR